MTNETEGCREQRRQYTRTWEIVEDYEPFELSVEPATVMRGEQITIRLRNRTPDEQLTGNDQKYALQRKSAGGWDNLLYLPNDRGVTDEGETHEPGDGFTWEFTASKDGFSKYPYRVCSEISQSRYRFLYWGISAEVENGESALAVEFDVSA